MTDGDALYRAIVASPEDDTPRLVYADWLEENGREEQAEFIRVECRLESASADLEEYADLLDRREELRLWLRTHAPWSKVKLGKRLHLGIGGDSWSYTARGFPCLQSVPRNGPVRQGTKAIRAFAASLEKAFAVLPTHELNVRVGSLEELAELLRQPVISALDRLFIRYSSDEQTGDEAAQIVANCKLLQNLRRASLVFQIGEAGAEALGRSEHLGRLESLSLDAYNLSPAAIRSLGSGAWFRRLQHLTLADGLSTEAFEELCRLPPLPNLHSLNLSGNSLHLPGNNFTAAAWDEFARCRAFPRLTQLELYGTDMSEGQMAGLASAGSIALSSLDLSHCSIGNEGARMLAQARWLGSLRCLNLRNNRLGPTSASALSACGQLAALKHLDLSGNHIGATGLKAISGSANLRNLTMLLLADCSLRENLPPAHFREFLEKLELPNLRYLDLTAMPIGPSAARLLTNEKFSNLTRLWLGNCNLTDAAASELLLAPALQNLIELRLEDNGLKSGVSALADPRVLPRLSMCTLAQNAIGSELCSKLSRRPGIDASAQRMR